MFKFKFILSKQSLLFVCLGLGSVCNEAIAQGTSVLSLQDTTNRPLITSVPFLNIALDSRATGMGDAGVATSPDANSVYWNAAKLAFAQEKSGASLTYNPWLRGLGVTDMFLTSLSGFYKIDDKQAVGTEIRYFNLGNIEFTDFQGKTILNFTPREYAVAFSYARKLSQKMSMSVTGRYINSNLTGDVFNGSASQDAKPGRSASADVGFFYTNPKIKLGNKEGSLNIGANISNIGGKISYISNGSADFLPTNMRIGAALTIDLDPLKKNQVTMVLDMNKLLVPSPAQYNAQGKWIKGDTTNKGVISGMFGSFTDAPGGFKEELQEVIICGGIEYLYNQTFAARIGYFNESKFKGNRKYFTLGAGFRSKQFGIDVSYLVPQASRNSALDGTIRFTAMAYFGTTNKKTVMIENE